MQTPSHFLITAAIRKICPKIPMVKSAVFLGAVAPDIPLILLSIGSFIYYHLFLDWPLPEAGKYIYSVLFYQDPVWIISHNTLQAPFILIGCMAAIWKFNGKSAYEKNWWFWFIAACMLHAVIDILTHNDDGPLMLFPFNWDYRFASPVSYWDRDHYADQFKLFERGLNIILLTYLAGPPVWRWGKRKFSS